LLSAKIGGEPATKHFAAFVELDAEIAAGRIQTCATPI
jgi:hypothetical protein